MTSERGRSARRTCPPAELMPERLAGKRVVIWGAGTHGGGLAAATWCAEAGARVAILDRQPPRELPEVMAQAGKHGWPWHLGQARHPAVRNCDLIVASPAISPQALAELPADAAPVVCPEALFFAVHRGQRIAVSGTKGKSTTAAMCGTLLDWAVAGNSHQPLLELLRRYGPTAPVVCELSSFQLWHLRELKPRFAVGLMTSLHRDHIDWHGSEEHYRATKLTLLDWCDTVIVPPELREISGRHSILASEVRYRDGAFTMADGTQIAKREQLPLPGEHNAVNAALALTAAVHLGLDPAIAGIRLTQVTSLPHRLQAVHARGDLVFVDDSIATTPEATMAGLAACDGPLAVILGGADKGADYAGLATAMAARGARAVCLGRTGDAIRDRLLAQGIEATVVPDLEAAVIRAVELLGGAGTVLLSPACASTDMFRDFADRGMQFAEVARSGWPATEDQGQELSAAAAPTSLLPPEVAAPSDPAVALWRPPGDLPFPPMDLRTAPGPRVPRFLMGFDLRRRPCLEADVVVVGSGIAGFAAALAAAEAGSEVLLLTKAGLPESNSTYAQGGIAAVLQGDRRGADDDLERHVTDTIAAGAGLCDEARVRDILEAGDDAIAFLERHGCSFDLDQDGAVALTREGGHSARRILHALGDATGREITRALGQAVLANDNITVIENAFAIDLITVDGVCRGVLYHRRGVFFGALGGSTVLATGGCGRVFRETTNPPVATGDGLAMAYRAGARVADLEFMQFHPTTLYLAGAARLLITEAMRGEGAHLLNHAGERFMTGYHEDAELAPRDVVSQAIVAEIDRGGFPHVWLDATHLDEAFLRERFPTIHRACSELNIDISRDWIPVHPSAHYHCGGIVTDTHGRTSIAGLLACGEVACTGLHGANRLASNSLLEGLVVGLRCGGIAHQSGGYPPRVRLEAERMAPAPETLDALDVERSLRAMMWRDVGIERTGTQLATAVRTIRFWMDHQAWGFFPDEQGWQLQNQLTVGALIAAAAAERSASVGTHRRADSAGEVETTHIAYQRPEEGP